MLEADHNRRFSDFLRILRRSTDLLNEDPIKEEIFSVERLEQYASYLATELKVSPARKRGQSLTPGLKRSGQKLLEAYHTLASAIRLKQPVSPAAEWFVDNFHIIEDQLREIKQNLPKNYYYELPKLDTGELQGFPRVYAMALAIIAHTDSRLDAATLKRFVLAFSHTTPLSIGELWALPITLRIALVEHLRPLADLVVTAKTKREEADAFADRLLQLAAQPETDSKDLVFFLGSELGEPEYFDRAFVVQLTQRLRDQDPDVWPAFDWLEKQLATMNTNTHQVTQLEHHRQAAAQVTVGNIISSMRLLSALDWRDFFEEVSLVDPVLAKDPAGIYSKMDFATRDRYRHRVEEISRRSKMPELDVVRSLVEMAAKAKMRDPGNIRRTHIGYYLIGEGRREFEKQCHYRPKIFESLGRVLLARPTLAYLGSLVFLTLVLMTPLVLYFLQSGGSLRTIGLFIFLGIFPASEFALTILNHYVTLVVTPKPLPKMNTQSGIPLESRTMVVIPTLFTKEHVVRELLESLEIHHLANQDSNVFFALLGDFRDAPAEHLPEDEFLLKLAQEGVEELNQKYASKGEKRFFLFHRRRQFNPSENKWMGWERKRGKLHEFNRLLRGAGATSFIVTTAAPEFLKSIKYVLTLDSDTRLPRDAAQRLIGTMMHPLNQAVYDEKLGRVVEGYGILQPRISISMVSAARSRFAKIYSGNTGLDPYTTAVSDVYQDVFGEGSFVGKGLYDVDTFEQALAQRVPENYLLSHDLFEGSFARSGLVTDVELFDDYPLDYETFSKRQHRWIRGDWQISQWILPRVPREDHSRGPNPLRLVSRWKILDNLRRSLSTAATFLWLLLAWTLLPGSPLVWTLVIVAMLAFPVYAPVTNSILLRREGVPWKNRLLADWAYTDVKIKQILLTAAFLAEEAWSHVDAILRTLYRKHISHKNLLEWVSFAQIQPGVGPSVDDKSEKNLAWLWRKLGPSPVLSGASAIVISVARPNALWVASPILLAWMMTPLLKSWLRKKAKIREVPLGKHEKKMFRRYARRTWHFFESFVVEKDNWLAPDNFQEEPNPVVAHRTSPTNIGLQLLSTAAAFDFGYLGLWEYVETMEKVFNTLSKLQKMHGHFFNWYNTQTLEPLRPQYISTVDSGNLAGHLLTVKQALLELFDRPMVGAHAREGLSDTLLELWSVIEKIENASVVSATVTLSNLKEAVEQTLRFAQDTPVKVVGEWERFLKGLENKLVEVEDILNAVAMGASSDKFRETRVWLVASLKLVRSNLRDLLVFDAEKPASPNSDPASNSIPNLASNLTTRVREDENSVLYKKVQSLVFQSNKIVLEMDFKFLFDDQRKIFVIGYNVADGRRDNSYYDLLASESRLASFVAIAKGEVPQEHWFRLGRQMTLLGHGRALISWSATMFEYLMPLLVMQRYSDTLLDETYESVVARQMEYGKQQSVPWGISEAGYNARDLQLNYQYGPFGIPGLGLKRGLSDDLVISPYSTMLASVIQPWEALKNLESLERIEAFSEYGFYESIDYTPDRLPKKQKMFILKSYMAHHQGMSLVSLDNLLHHKVMQKRFHTEPLVRATQLLLQERIPLAAPLTRPRAEEVSSEGFLHFSMASNPRTYNDVQLPTPRTQLLSNGAYSVMITTSGSGYSRMGKIAVSRWREDTTRDQWGHFYYVRNRSNGALWSTGHAPTAVAAQSYEVTFAEDKVEFWRRDGEATTHTEILVSPEDNVEMRRISITNNSQESAEFEVTSFMETVLAPHADDVAHPAFSNLFVQTEFISAENALLATRRRRSENENQIWGFHVVVAESESFGGGEVVGSVQYETDRSRFLGRGREASRPFVLSENRPLSNTVGAVLDPIFSLRQSVRIPAGETMRLTFSTGIAHSRGEALRLVDKYHDIHIFARETELAWTKSQVQLRHLNISSDKAHSYQRLAGRVIYSDSSLRPRSHLLALNTKAQSSLWGYGISGDLPIVLTRISDEKDMVLVRELLHAHEYLRLKGLAIDLVILNERASSYVQALQDELQRQIRISGSQTLLDKPGGIFIRRTDQIPEEDLILLKTVARVTLSAEMGTLDQQLKRRPVEVELPKLFEKSLDKKTFPDVPPPLPELEFYNGLGGFAHEGRQYVVSLKDHQWTPAPWINVIANEKDFGFIVSESGAGYTWSVNSRENRITPWSNDAVSDPIGECLYIRDEESGEFWSPTPLPIRENEHYAITHGQGFTRFEHNSHGLLQDLVMFVPLEAEVKVCRLLLKNIGRKKRVLSVTSYVEWVLGFQRGSSAPYVVTEADPGSGALLATNPYNNEFASRVSFAALTGTDNSFTADRKEFIGRNGSLARPAALLRESLSGTTGAGLDPCAAFQTKFELAPGEEKEILVLLGQAESREKALELAARFQDSEEAKRAFKESVDYWERALTVIEVQTPDAAMNTLMNRWFLYQTLSCRLWGRSAFYQSGGAYGFRDQLQDVMALVYSKPEIAKEHILRAAARQFEEGDVQHWWHPPTGRGVRTHCSDDLLWLPYVTSFYVKVTGDQNILQEEIPFIEARPLEAGEEDSYTKPDTSKKRATLREHCYRSLDRSLKVGAHGLPLMGNGDWNDGMNRVGHKGQGESVWVAWFLYACLKNFLPHCEKQSERVQTYENHMERLKKAVEENAWDGDWYRRAFFDDGQVLGSASNQECRIDSIAQSWAVLSGAANFDRALRAMASVDQYLVHRGDGLVKLFTPPFDQSSVDPGYIKGYLPGVRENGGQYTHAAIWALMAFAELGEGDLVGELYSLLNPINHSSTRAGLHKYKVEPYVAAADIYGLSPHVGRGGWTWYTGSASWMYRSALESILGFRLQGDTLEISPCIPRFWRNFEIKYRRGTTTYKISVENPDGQSHVTRAPSIELDGQRLKTFGIPLVEDGAEHRIRVVL